MSIQIAQGSLNSSIRSFSVTFLRGCGQMLFQPSALTGGAFLLLILSQSTASFVMCVAGALGSTLCAYALEHPDEEYFQGLGGFNGGLLGLALSVFYEFSGLLLTLAFRLPLPLCWLPGLCLRAPIFYTLCRPSHR